jgi:hypothetical protein
MTPLRWLGAAVLAVLIAVAAWLGYQRYAAPQPASGIEPAALPAETGQRAGAPSLSDQPTDVVTVDANQGLGVPTGGTPMRERVAVIGFLNKRNGESREVVLKPGQATRIGDAVIRLRACETTAPWEPDQYTGAFLQLDVRGRDDRWRRSFSGWVFRERPGLNVVQHPIYDVWPKSCTMSFPATGPDTVVLGSGEDAPKASSARQSPSTAARPGTSPPTDAPSAAPSNAI